MENSMFGKDELKKLFIMRENKIAEAKNFLDSHSDENGKIKREHAREFEKMQKDIEFLSHDIQRELGKPTRPAIKNTPMNSREYFGEAEMKASKGVAGESYRREFFDQFKQNFRGAYNTLVESQADKGGYLLPTEFHNEIISELKDENILRRLATVIETVSDRKICITSTAPTADFVEEGQEIALSSEQFTQKTLSAYKLACGVSVSNELLSDSFFDLENHLASEFAKAIGSREEDALLNGSGTNEPLGLIEVLTMNTTMTIQTSGTSLESDDLLNLVYELPRPYRKNAAFLMSDMTLAAIRKLKDSDQRYVWAQSLTAGEPDRLLGYPVYSSGYMPSIAAEKIPVIFGDFSKFIIGQRGNFSFKPLYELHALRDLSTFLAIERFDGILSDNHAMRGLKVKA